jgi:hypothetical protein
MNIKNIFTYNSKTFGLSDKSNRFYLVIVALLILFAYLPTLQYNYATNDQWRAFQYSILDGPPLIKALKIFESPGYFNLRSGRPFCVIGEFVEHVWVGKINDFSTTRPIVLIIVIFTAFCIGLALSSSVGGIVNGTAIGALFVLSPGYAYMYYIGLSAIMILVSLILATLSYIFLRQAMSEDFHKNKLLLSSVCFLTACLIYPAWAFVVFIYTLMDFLFCINSERRTRLKHLLIKTFFFTAISIIYYLIIKLIIIFLPADNAGVYEFSANFNPVYLSVRFFNAFVNFIVQPPLNTLYNSLSVLNLIFLSLVIVICSFLFFKRNNYKSINTYCSFLFIIFICVFLISASIAPWLLSKMPNAGNRYFISFSLLMCALIGWVIFRVSTKLFPTRKYISTILIIFIILLPATAIQNKRTAIEVGISGTEIETMRMIVHKWIDESSFTKKRYIVVVKPKRPRPLFYDRVLNSTEYRDSMAFAGYSIYYFQMFKALIREECDFYHPFTLMKIYDLSFSQEEAEKILDNSPSNIVFKVINQGDRVKTKHDVLEINFSLITNLPEPLIIEQ